MKKIFTIMLIALMLCAPIAFAGTVSRTLLSAVGATGESSAVDCGDIDTKTIYIVAATVTTGATIAVQTSYDNTNWVSIHSEVVTATGVTEIAVVGLYQKYVRVNVTSWTDGAYTVYFFGKN